MSTLTSVCCISWSARTNIYTFWECIFTLHNKVCVWMEWMEQRKYVGFSTMLIWFRITGAISITILSHYQVKRNFNSQQIEKRKWEKTNFKINLLFSLNADSTSLLMLHVIQFETFFPFYLSIRNAKKLIWFLPYYICCLSRLDWMFIHRRGFI